MITTTSCILNGVQFVSRDVERPSENDARSERWGDRLAKSRRDQAAATAVEAGGLPSFAKRAIFTSLNRERRAAR
jgi:hypothetical protein